LPGRNLCVLRGRQAQARADRHPPAGRFCPSAAGRRRAAGRRPRRARAESVTSLIGQSTARIEDRDLLCGTPRFVADITMPGILHASFVPSPHAHANIVSIDTRAALELPGVMAVLTGKEIRAVVARDRLAVALPDRSYKQQRDRAILAADETVHVGEAIAMVLATDAYVAEDG